MYFLIKLFSIQFHCVDSIGKKGAGYVIAGVVSDDFDEKNSSGHEYWIFSAESLSSGPICKLGHPELNNSTLFHSVYISDNDSKRLDSGEPSYQVDLQKDYPEEEIGKWDESVLELFREVIWPYFDINESAARLAADKNVQQFSAQRIRDHVGSEHIIGEERIEDGAAFAERMVAEAERIWQTSGWAAEYNKKGLLVESKPVSGVFSNAGILITRGSGEINVPAQDAFDLLVSPEGYAIIDPVSAEGDHSLPPLEVYEWREGSRLEAAIAGTNLPFMPVTEFVVLNAIDPSSRIFVSKSIIHDNHPGGSVYSSEKSVSGAPVRALNTFAIKIESVSDKRCRVLSINYADMAGKTPGSVNNLINTKYFLPALYRRMSRVMEKDQ